MEAKELEVRRQVFELELNFLIFAHIKSPERKPYRKIDVDEFKMIYDREFS